LWPVVDAAVLEALDGLVQKRGEPEAFHQVQHLCGVLFLELGHVSREDEQESAVGVRHNRPLVQAARFLGLAQGEHPVVPVLGAGHRGEVHLQLTRLRLHRGVRVPRDGAVLPARGQHLVEVEHADGSVGVEPVVSPHAHGPQLDGVLHTARGVGLVPPTQVLVQVELGHSFWCVLQDTWLLLRALRAATAAELCSTSFLPPQVFPFPGFNKEIPLSPSGMDTGKGRERLGATLLGGFDWLFVLAFEAQFVEEIQHFGLEHSGKPVWVAGEHKELAQVCV